MKELLISMALGEDGKLYRPTQAQKGQNYVCPECEQAVILRQGEVRIKHFAHRAETNCTAESVLHKTAKRLIQQVVAERQAQGRPITILRSCACGIVRGQTLPAKVDAAVLEKRLEDGSVVDVALMGGDAVLAAVEIFVTHAVDEAKAARLSVPWVELGGEAVLEHPTRWEPRQDHFRVWTCEGCIRREQEKQAEFEKAIAAGQAFLLRLQKADEQRKDREEMRRIEAERRAAYDPQKDPKLQRLVWKRVREIAEGYGVKLRAICRYKATQCQSCQAWMVVNALGVDQFPGVHGRIVNTCPVCGREQDSQLLEESGGSVWVEPEVALEEMFKEMPPTPEELQRRRKAAPTQERPTP